VIRRADDLYRDGTVAGRGKDAPMRGPQQQRPVWFGPVNAWRRTVRIDHKGGKQAVGVRGMRPRGARTHLLKCMARQMRGLRAACLRQVRANTKQWSRHLDRAQQTQA